ncbi:Mss4-like protein [Amanita rubescens]|nr:Mss4-like protein [Amanita rubescens]
MPYEGQCLCGGCKVFVDTEPRFKGMGICHCKDCYRSNGSAYACAVPVNSESVRAEGTVKLYSFVNPASHTVSRWFCSGCGSHLYSGTTARPERMSVKAGNFEEFTKLPVVLEIFVKDRWPGIPPIPGALQKEDGNVNLSEMPQAAKTKLVATEEQADEAGLLRAQH